MDPRLKNKKCGTCGAQATSVEWDVREKADLGPFISWSFTGGVRYGCQAHPVESKKFDALGELLPA